MYENPNEAQRKKTRPYRIAAVLAIVLFLVIAPEVQEGNSMDPTIKDGDVCVVYKFARYSAKRTIPDRGTIVVLDKTISLDAGADDNIIARVIAVPGDTVEVKNDKVLVNGKAYKTRHDISGATGTFKKKKLKGNQIFVLSDNRSESEYESLDSRNPKLGLVDMRKIRGNVLVRLWPLNRIKILASQ